MKNLNQKLQDLLAKQDEKEQETFFNYNHDEFIAELGDIETFSEFLLRLSDNNLPYFLNSLAYNYHEVMKKIIAPVTATALPNKQFFNEEGKFAVPKQPKQNPFSNPTIFIQRSHGIERYDTAYQPPRKAETFKPFKLATDTALPALPKNIDEFISVIYPGSQFNTLEKPYSLTGFRSKDYVLKWFTWGAENISNFYPQLHDYYRKKDRRSLDKQLIKNCYELLSSNLKKHTMMPNELDTILETYGDDHTLCLTVFKTIDWDVFFETNTLKELVDKFKEKPYFASALKIILNSEHLKYPNVNLYIPELIRALGEAKIDIQSFEGFFASIDIVTEGKWQSCLVDDNFYLKVINQLPSNIQNYLHRLSKKDISEDWSYFSRQTKLNLLLQAENFSKLGTLKIEAIQELLEDDKLVFQASFYHPSLVETHTTKIVREIFKRVKSEPPTTYINQYSLANIKSIHQRLKEIQASNLKIAELKPQIPPEHDHLYFKLTYDMPTLRALVIMGVGAAVIFALGLIVFGAPIYPMLGLAGGIIGFAIYVVAPLLIYLLYDFPMNLRIEKQREQISTEMLPYEQNVKPYEDLHISSETLSGLIQTFENAIPQESVEEVIKEAPSAPKKSSRTCSWVFDLFKSQNNKDVISVGEEESHDAMSGSSVSSQENFTKS